MDNITYVIDLLKYNLSKSAISDYESKIIDRMYSMELTTYDRLLAFVNKARIDYDNDMSRIREDFYRRPFNMDKPYINNCIGEVTEYSNVYEKIHDELSHIIITTRHYEFSKLLIPMIKKNSYDDLIDIVEGLPKLTSSNFNNEAMYDARRDSLQRGHFIIIKNMGHHIITFDTHALKRINDIAPLKMSLRVPDSLTKYYTDPLIEIMPNVYRITHYHMFSRILNIPIAFINTYLKHVYRISDIVNWSDPNIIVSVDQLNKKITVHNIYNLARDLIEAGNDKRETQQHIINIARMKHMD